MLKNKNRINSINLEYKRESMYYGAVHTPMTVVKTIITLNYVTQGGRKDPLVYTDLCSHFPLLKDPLGGLVISDLSRLRLSCRFPQELCSILQQTKPQ